MSYRIIIPARIGSTRLPNKPLKEIAGKTLIERVVDQARKTSAKSIHVATDSDEIMYHCNEINVEALLTSSNHKTGSDRLADIEDSIDAFNAYRVQVNQSLLKLREQINDLELALSLAENE